MTIDAENASSVDLPISPFIGQYFLNQLISHRRTDHSITLHIGYSYHRGVHSPTNQIQSVE